jgi:hypothetical protein
MIEKGTVMVKKRATHLTKELPLLPSQDVTNKGLQLPKVLFHVESNYISVTVVIYLRTWLGPFVKSSQRLAKLFHVLRADFVLPNELPESNRIRQLPHLDCILDYLTTLFKRELAHSHFVDGNHFLVNTLTEPPVQGDFSFAEISPVVQLTKIEKTEINGFLEFVDPFARQEYGRNMGVTAFDTANRMRIEAGISHRLANGIETLPLVHFQFLCSNLRAFAAFAWTFFLYTARISVI